MDTDTLIAASSDAACPVLAVSMKRLAEITSFSRAFLYEEAAAGRLKLTRKGRRTVVTIDDARVWLHGPSEQREAADVAAG